jgi:hypothetical protein
MASGVDTRAFALLPKIVVSTAILVLRARASFVFGIPREPVIEFAIFPHLLVTLLQRFDALKVLTVETFPAFAFRLHNCWRTSIIVIVVLRGSKYLWYKSHCFKNI